QVKIRGIRIELSEIEKSMLEIDKVEEAVVIEKYDASGKNYLCAYYTSIHHISAAVFKDKLTERLPRYMIPSYFIRVDNIPLTPNGKVDRKLLPEPTANITDNTEYIPPTNDTEEKLAKAWKDVLHLQKVSTDSDFFELGGDSLAIMQILTATSRYNWNLGLNDFFELRTIKNIATKIDTQTEAALPEICATDIETIDINEETAYIQTIPDKLNNVLLTGATGYLGSHLLKYLLSRPSTKIYCMIRVRNNTPSVDRLIEKMKFYFNEDCSHFINKRIFIINGDIALDNFGMTENEYSYLAGTLKNVIHSATIVMHFGNYSEFNEVNVNGTKRIIKFALENNIELKHISTLSIFGNYLTNSEMKDKKYNECDFYVNQDYNENVYVRTKFEAENLVLKAMKEGLNATIFRLGNLTGRYDDGHFQENISENYFYNGIRSVVKLGIIPKNFLNMAIDFTPVDCASQAIVIISETKQSNGRVFHIFNHNSLKAYEILRIFVEMGFENIKSLDYDEFKRYIRDISRDEKRKSLLFGFVNEIMSNEEIIYNDNINLGSDITCRYLSKLGFEWPIIDGEYIGKLVKYMQEVNFI
ncbi:MAG: NAD-dependent epimerase/dehydratase family protein, partial [Clostridiaceae bacterium]|nr:NAD-dependent epimerase/dehydratase family protein [Clostridiaceae bacterium]